MTPAEIDRVFGRARMRMMTGEHVEVFREEAREGEERRYTKRFLETASGDFRPWTEREWRILDRLGARGDAAVARVVRFFPADDTGMPRLQTRDAGPTVDQWAALVPLRRTAPVLPYVFGDCTTWWALARQCLIAFEPLHALGFVHLDFKADNVCVPWKPLHATRPAAGQAMAPDFDGLALIDVAFSLLPGVDLPGALPLTREPGFEYQSPRLLEALDEGRRGELRPTLELDWRCDFFSLAAMLWRMLPEIDDVAGTGWARERHAWATQFVSQLLDIHGSPLPAARPHRALITEAALRLSDPQLAATLQSGSSFDPERAWPNGAEAMPLTRVAATPLARRGERIEPRFAMPTPATQPPASAAPSAAARVDAATPVTAAFAATAPPPVVDDEVAPTGAQVDLPLDVEIDVPLDVAVDLPLEAPVAHAIDIPADVAAERTIDLDAEAAVARAAEAPFARTVDASAAERADARRSEPIAASTLAAAVAGTAPATAPMARAAAVEARTPMTIGADATTEAPTWRTLPEPASWPAPLDDGEPRPFAPFDSTPPETAIGAGEDAAEHLAQRPRAPASSQFPILAAAGVGALIVAAAAWWQLDGRARFDSGIERVAAPAPAAESVAAVPLPPEAVAAGSEGSTATASNAAPTTEPATTAGGAADVTAASTATAPPAAAATSAAPAIERDRTPAATGTAAAPAALEASAAAWMRDRVPGLARAAERRLAPVLAAAARSPELRRRSEIRTAAQSARAVVAPPSGTTFDAREAQRLDDAAQAAVRRDRDFAAALHLQTRAFGANPLDPAVAGNLALLRLNEPSPQAEPARQLALHALTLKDDRFPTGRIEDWTTLAIAAALTGRERDARNAWFVSMALTGDLQRQCDAAVHARATYGERVRPSVQAMLQRARSSAAYGRCEIPQAAPAEKRAGRGVKSKSTQKAKRAIP
jgi:hypothetical protein